MPIIAISRGGVEVGIVVIVVTFFTEASLLITQMLKVLFLEAILRYPLLLLQYCRLLFETMMLLI
jgi:hypothetical protein